MDTTEELPSESISVEIYDQVYHLRGVDPEHIAHLAGQVDAKMRAVSASGSTVDSLRVAVLAALNIADELEALRERYAEMAGSVTQSRNRSATLAGKLDAMFDELEAPVRRVG